jgi:hypothetical protein
MEWVKSIEERDLPPPNEFAERWVRVINVLADKYPVQAKLAEALGMEYKQFRDVYEFRKAIFNVDFLKAVIALDRRVNPYYILFGIGPLFFDKFPLSELESSLPKSDDDDILVGQEPQPEYGNHAQFPKNLRKQLLEKDEQIAKLKKTIKTMADYISTVDK